VAVGFSNTLLYVSMFQVLWRLLHLNYKFAVTGAYLVAVTFHFSMNRMVTFQNNKGRLHHQIPKYVIMILINYLLTLGVVEVTVVVMLFSPDVGMLFSIAVTLMTGYLISKYWVFYSGDRRAGGTVDNPEHNVLRIL